MAGKGGYQAPAHPAPVSGPGALSARTDGGPGQPVAHLTDAQYGEDASYVAQQQAAPVAGTRAASGAGGPGGGSQPAGQNVVAGFGDPTANPSEPVTSGAALGPGPGPEALQPMMGAPQSYGTVTDMLSTLAASDSTGSIAGLLQQAMRLGLSR